MSVEPNMHDDAELAKIRANQEDPLIMYLVVRKGLNMSVGKIAAQCGHAAQMTIIRYYQELTKSLFPMDPDLVGNIDEEYKLFSEWMSTSFRKSVLAANDKEWEKLKEEPSLRCFVVRDAGLTEVEPGSETVMAIWPIRKSQAPKVLRRLQTLKDPGRKHQGPSDKLRADMTFEQAWAVKELEGYQYGHDALEGVRFGWEIHEEAIRNGK